MEYQRTVQPGGAMRQVQQYPDAGADLDWRVMKTLRGGFRVIVDGHLFIDQKVMRNPDHIRFTCIERKPMNCRCAVIMTKDHRTFIKLDQTHNHTEPDPSVFADLYDLDQDTSSLTKSSRKSRSRRTTENTIASDGPRIHSESTMDFEEEDEQERVETASPGPSKPILSDDIITLVFHQMTQEERIRAKSVSRYFNHISKQFLPTPNFKLNAELYISPNKRGPARYTFKAYNEQRCFSGLF
uniref:FLYWCH-type domain-containing protein n=1 Tax=Steinernema glaseri TaxID=37863 RepID=A0A1I7ZBE2_9BILA